LAKTPETSASANETVAAPIKNEDSSPAPAKTVEKRSRSNRSAQSAVMVPSASAPTAPSRVSNNAFGTPTLPSFGNSIVPGATPPSAHSQPPPTSHPETVEDAGPAPTLAANTGDSSSAALTEVMGN